jgi:cytochrome d ubiquinol oxidase subunit II
MSLELFTAGIMLAGLVIYAVTGGADFGGGVWDLFARGPRGAAQRKAIERALAPVWEANHVWLIFILVILFTGFPRAFARLGTQLHVPLTLLLIGIVLRGAAFVFRHYGSGRLAVRWGLVFAISSLLTPIGLGIALGAMTAGPVWWRPFPLAVGVLTVCVFAFLAAVYLVVEVADPQLRAEFRRRGMYAAVAVAGAAVLAMIAAHQNVPRFADRLLHAPWAVPLIGIATATLLGAGIALRQQRDRVARVSAIACVAVLVLGWGAAQYPLLVAPDLTLTNAAAPRMTFVVLVPVILTGAVVMLPALWWLMRVFKTDRTSDDEARHPEN